MPMQALQLLERKIERQIRLFGLKRGRLERKIERKIEHQIQLLDQKRGALERKIEQQIRLFEIRKGVFEQKIGTHLRRFEEKKKGIRLDDEVRFIRTWMEKPLSLGAVTPSGKALARTMAAYVDPKISGPIIELGPGTGPVTEALVAQGIDPARLVLVEFDPAFCRILRARYPAARVVQGDAYSLRRVLSEYLREPAAAVVSGLPLFTKPLRQRLHLIYEAFGLMLPGAPFVQFTYAAVPPIPRTLDRVRTEASERIWMNIPPARVWVYRRR